MEQANTLGINYQSSDSLVMAGPILVIVLIGGLVVFIAYKKFFG